MIISVNIKLLKHQPHHLISLHHIVLHQSYSSCSSQAIIKTREDNRRNEMKMNYNEQYEVSEKAGAAEHVARLFILSGYAHVSYKFISFARGGWRSSHRGAAEDSTLESLLRQCMHKNMLPVLGWLFFCLYSLFNSHSSLSISSSSSSTYHYCSNSSISTFFWS